MNMKPYEIYIWPCLISKLMAMDFSVGLLVAGALPIIRIDICADSFQHFPEYLFVLLILGLCHWPLTNKFASCPAGSAKPVAYAHDYDETMPMEEQSIPPAAEFSMAMQISSEEEPLEQSPGGPSQVGTDWFKTSHP